MPKTPTLSYPRSSTSSICRAELHELIIRKTDGNPYFIEEVVRTLIDHGAVLQTDSGLQWKAGTNVADIPISDSLQALLMARIDRLDEQPIDAAGGFGHRARLLLPDSGEHLRQGSDIWQADAVAGTCRLLREAGRVPELEYMFSTIGRDAAYGSMSTENAASFTGALARRWKRFSPAIWRSMPTGSGNTLRSLAIKRAPRATSPWRRNSRSVARDYPGARRISRTRWMPLDSSTTRQPSLGLRQEGIQEQVLRQARSFAAIRCRFGAVPALLHDYI